MSSNNDNITKEEDIKNMDTTTTVKKKKEKKQPPPGIVIPPKKPKLTKAERRALQEQQRASKAASVATGGGKGKKKDKDGGGKKDRGSKNTASTELGGKSGKQSDSESAVQQQFDTENHKTLSLFSHLPPYQDKKEFQKEFSGMKLGSDETIKHNLHPAVLSLGLQYANGTIIGANARARAMLQTFAIVIRDYYTKQPETNSTQKKRQHLEKTILKPSFTYWTTKCRIHSISMGNAFTFLKLAISNICQQEEEEEGGQMQQILDTIHAYIHQRMDLAKEAISKYATTKIVNDGDVILTYGRSEVVQDVLQDAIQNQGKQFRLIIVDSRPLLEGRDVVELFSATENVEITYVLLNSLSYVMMGEVTKVFLGAAALMSNGSILSRVGTASVALMAKANNVPVLVCCETYKICSRVQLESITGNELGNVDDLIRTTSSTMMMDDTKDDKENKNEKKLDKDILGDWHTIPSLKLLNLLYDLTPSEFVSGIVTELGILPPTSVAVLVREMNLESAEGI